LRRATSQRSSSRTPSPKKQKLKQKRVSIAVENFLSDSSSGEDLDKAESPPKVRRLLQIRPSPVRNRNEYTYYEPRDEVESIVREFTTKGRVMYMVKLEGGATKEVRGAASPSNWERVRAVAVTAAAAVAGERRLVLYSEAPLIMFHSASSNYLPLHP
jgi:hypothetical protein